MNWDYKLTKPQIKALKILIKYKNGMPQNIADKVIHWRTQYNLYVKLLADNIATDKGCIFRITERGLAALI